MPFRPRTEAAAPALIGPSTGAKFEKPEQTKAPLIDHPFNAPRSVPTVPTLSGALFQPAAVVLSMGQFSATTQNPLALHVSHYPLPPFPLPAPASATSRSRPSTSRTRLPLAARTSLTRSRFALPARTPTPTRASHSPHAPPAPAHAPAHAPTPAPAHSPTPRSLLLFMLTFRCGVVPRRALAAGRNSL